MARMTLSNRFDLQIHVTEVDTVSATLAGVRSDGASVTIMVTEADFEAIRTSDDQDEVALRLLDAAPVAHILHIEQPL